MFLSAMDHESLFHHLQVVGMGVSFVNWRVVSSCFSCFPKSFSLGGQVLVEVTSLFYNEQKTNKMQFERNAYACIRWTFSVGNSGGS